MSGDWSIQAPPEEGTPFLLYRGVLIGRLYGGAPISEMLRLLNAVDKPDPPDAPCCGYGCGSSTESGFVANAACPMHGDQP